MQPIAAPCFSRRSIVRIVADLVATELTASRGRDPREGGELWSETTRFDDHGFDLDSLERLAASSALSEYFHLHEHGTEDYLLAQRTLGEWCDIVEDALAATGARVTFRTSGSTGTPKRITHELANLALEVDGWVAALAPAPIVALVPGHHIYGTMFTALLPDRLGTVCDDVRWSLRRLTDAAPGTIVIGTPTQWARVARVIGKFPPGLVGVTSTAPMPAALWHTLREQGLQRLIEVYGSSETAGIGQREGPDEPFTLLPHVARSTAGVSRATAGGEAIEGATLDAVEWIDDRRFVLGGRHDAMVQVGGHNVDPAAVRDVVRAHPDVADAHVRLDGASMRLKAFVVPVDRDHDPRTLSLALDQWCGSRLTSAQRPRRFDVGPALPLSAMGKPIDW